MNRKLPALCLSLIVLTLLHSPAVRAQQGGLDPALQTLSTGNVYVDSRLSGVDVQKLEQAAMQGQGNPHTRVKIALLAALPAQFSSRNGYADQLHHDLGMDKDALVLVALRGHGAGVSVVTSGLDRAESGRLANQYGSAIVADPSDGTARLAEAVAGDINNTEYRSTGGLWAVFLLVIVVVGVLIFLALRRKKQTMVAAREPIQALRENVLSGIEYVDGYVDTLPKNNPDSDQVQDLPAGGLGQV